MDAESIAASLRPGTVVPSKLTPPSRAAELHVTAFKLLAMGISMKTVANTLGVSGKTVREWRERYPEALERAREDHLREAECNLIVKLQALAEESVDRARKLIPEATYRDLVTGAGVGSQRYSELRRGAPPPQMHVHLTREQLDAQLQELSKELTAVEATAEDVAEDTD